MVNLSIPWDIQELKTTRFRSSYPTIQLHRTMYRIPIICVTACLTIAGCGGPSASELYDLEKRISATESGVGDTAQQLEAMGSKTDSVAQQLVDSERNLDQRLTGIENTLETLNKQLTQNGSAATRTAGTVDAADLKRLEKKIVELEAKLATNDAAPNTRRSLIPAGDIPDAKKEEMRDESDSSNKTSRKPKKRSGSKGFEITLLSWNVESEGSDPNLIAKQLAEMNRYDVYGLCEVLPESIELFAEAVGKNYRTIATRSGFNDRLQIIYDAEKFELLRRLELKEINFEYRYRSPLVAHLRHRSSGQEIMVLNNHLARGRAEVRTQQARQLVEWARNQNVPLVAIGDYNFDFVFQTRKGNDGFVAMLRDNIWQWVEPVELIDTNWYDNPKSPDGIDDYPGSILDFAFVAGAATTWKNECRVIVRPGDFPDDETTSDHRPFELRMIKR